MTYNEILISKTDRRSGIEAWAVTFNDKTGRAMQTTFTTIREEAISWGRNIRINGWTTEGRPGPALSTFT